VDSLASLRVACWGEDSFHLLARPGTLWGLVEVPPQGGLRYSVVERGRIDA
jgi:hypothetical protein